MVSNINVASLTGNGMRDWLIQRVSSVILGLYVIFILAYLIMNPDLGYFGWINLFAHHSMRIFSVLFLISLMLHAWVGMWTVATDYLKWFWVKLLFEIGLIIISIVYLIWGIEILWSI